MRIALNNLIASVFYTGYIKRGGGTAAALIAAAIIYLVNDFFVYFCIMSLSVILGTYVSDNAESSWGHDSSRIVIDEFAGMCLALFLLPHSIYLFLAAFILFRVFDIFKPFPVNYMERIDTGTGVMMDDILSGLMANGILWFYICLRTMHA